MSSYHQVYSEFSSHPEAYNQYDSSPIPKQADYSDLEAVRRPSLPPNYPPSYPQDAPLNEKQQSRKICGLRVVTFWLSLALVVVIIVAAVGGGVGGALAASDNNKSPSGTVTQTPSGTGAAAAASSTGFARLYCQNETVYTTPTGARFKQICAIDWAGGTPAEGGGKVNDIQIRMASSYQSCINQCASYNKNSPNLQKCEAIAFNADLTDTVEDFGGNCWFKVRLLYTIRRCDTTMLTKIKDAPGTMDTLLPEEDDPEKYAVAKLLED